MEIGDYLFNYVHISAFQNVKVKPLQDIVRVSQNKISTS